MGTFDMHFGDRQGKPTLAREIARADGLQRRVLELRADNALLKNALRSVREELATLRRCLGDKTK